MFSHFLFCCPCLFTVFFTGKTPSQYILSILRSVKLAEISETLLTLPFDYAVMLLQHISRILEQGNEVELCIKCALLLIRIHQNQLISTQSLIEPLSILRKHARLRLTHYKDTIGTNMAALRYLQADIESSATANFFGEPTPAQAERSNKKRKYNTVARRHQTAKKGPRRSRV